MDDIKLFGKSQKELETDANNKNIHSKIGMEFGVENVSCL